MDDPLKHSPTPIREGISTIGPDRNWPQHCWWGAAHGSEVTQTPTMRGILELPNTVWGYKAVNANYMQLKEAVLDLIHFAVLHKKSLGISGWVRLPAVTVSDGRLIFRQLFDMAPLPAVYAVPAGKLIGKQVHRDYWAT